MGSGVVVAEIKVPSVGIRKTPMVVSMVAVHGPIPIGGSRGAREKELSLTVYDPNEDACHRIYNREIETPKVDGMGRMNETRAQTGRPFSSIDRGVSNSLMPRISPQDAGKVEESRKNGFEKSILPPGTNRPESVKSGRRQTRPAVRLIGAVSVDQDGFFARGQLRWIPKRRRIASAVVSGGEHG
ncbi:hypothetical protein CRG98_018311 [Punica granatum]|uniref:Uncharacterized protein n=1 Tax=Punica granatum TaxID=22663 RepID=A0A2I0JYC2_PUNGR|nr:hypothetical protein CRG98_018311 [Punica granatum]